MESGSRLYEFASSFTHEYPTLACVTSQSGASCHSQVALFSGACSCRRRTLLVSNRNDDSCPSPNVLAAVIPLVHIACNRHLQNYLIEPVADEASYRELALLLVAWSWRV